MIMRKLIIFLNIFWLAVNGLAQTTYQDLVPCTTNPTLGTLWDWRQPVFTAYVNYPNNQAVNITSPFFASGTSFNNNNIDFYSASTGEGRDFSPEGGWELIQKDFGLAPSVNPLYPLGQYIRNPYFILYKYFNLNSLYYFVYLPLWDASIHRF
jgi:hypothetical protein